MEVVSFHAGAGLTDKGLIVKLVNAGPETREVKLEFDGDLPPGTVTRITLAADPGARNTFEEPAKFVPVTDTFRFSGGGSHSLTLKPYSFVVLKGAAE